MRNLLAANFYRLRKSSAFWLALAATLAYTGLIVLVCWDHCADGTGNYTLEAILTAGFGLMGYLCIPSLILAPLLAVYLGTEHSEHTVRNKLITGHSKAGVYLAELAVCILTALTLDILFMLLAGLLCVWPVLQMSGVLLRVSVGQLSAWIAAALLARAAYASVIKLVATVLERKTGASIAALLLVAAAMLVCRTAFGMIHSLESALAAGRPVINAEGRLAFWHLLMDILPTGQAIQVSRLDTPNLWRMPLMSLAVIAVSTGLGLAVFRKKDLR